MTMQRGEVELMQAVFEQDSLMTSSSDHYSQVKRIFRRALGCWHRNLSLPFTRGSETYRTCTDCGARRRFNLNEWTMVGAYYRPEEPLTDDER